MVRSPGADRTRKGLFLEANHGTLFLDEIGELPMSMQTKLLHVIEEKQVRAVGSEQVRHVETRIVIATNRDLPAMVEQGKFREDLYFRLSMFQIALPPLRERHADLQDFVHFLLQNAGDIGPSGPVDDRPGRRVDPACVPVARQRARTRQRHQPRPHPRREQPHHGGRPAGGPRRYAIRRGR